MMNAVGTTIPASTKEKVAGGVLFGYTKNKQTGGTIKGYPQSQLMVFCDKNDGVCGGKLNVNAGHFVYPNNGDGDRAYQFLKKNIDQKLKKSGN
jgi:cutinase